MLFSSSHYPHLVLERYCSLWKLCYWGSGLYWFDVTLVLSSLHVSSDVLFALVATGNILSANIAMECMWIAFRWCNTGPLRLPASSVFRFVRTLLCCFPTSAAVRCRGCFGTLWWRSVINLAFTVHDRSFDQYEFGKRREVQAKNLTKLARVCSQFAAAAQARDNYVVDEMLTPASAFHSSCVNCLCY